MKTYTITIQPSEDITGYEVAVYNCEAEAVEDTEALATGQYEAEDIAGVMAMATQLLEDNTQ